MPPAPPPPRNKRQAGHSSDNLWKCIRNINIRSKESRPKGFQLPGLKVLIQSRTKKAQLSCALRNTPRKVKLDLRATATFRKWFDWSGIRSQRGLAQSVPVSTAPGHSSPTPLPQAQSSPHPRGGGGAPGGWARPGVGWTELKPWGSWAEPRTGVVGCGWAAAASVLFSFNG